MVKVIDCISEEDYPRYNELLDLAGKIKANAPKEKKVRGPLSQETKVKMAKAKYEKAQAALQALLDAEMSGETVTESTDGDA